MNDHHLTRGTFGFLGLCLVALVLSGCIHASPSASSTSTVPTPRASPSAPAPCQTQHLLLAFDRFGAATSNEAAQFVLVNQSKQSCTLSGYPALQLLDARHQPIPAHVGQSTGSPLHPTQAPHRFVLGPREKAYFVVAWANLGCGKIPPASFASPVSFLRVTPPLNQASLLVATQFGVEFCPFRNSVEISPLEPDNKVLVTFF